MLATGDVRFKEKMDLDIQVSKLRVLKQSYLSERYDLEDRIIKYYPKEIKGYEERITGYEKDVVLLNQHKPQGEDKLCPMTLVVASSISLASPQAGKLAHSAAPPLPAKSCDFAGAPTKAYTEKADAGQMLLALCKENATTQPVEIGSCRGFKMEVFYDTVNTAYTLNLCGAYKHKVLLGSDALGNLTQIENELARIPARLKAAKTQRVETIVQLENAKVEVEKPFAYEDELKEKTDRLNALNIELNLDEKDTPVMDTEPEQENEQPEKKTQDRER